ncbi:MAG TPA: hypothetical protein VFV27_03615 [Nevskiaceae bacterium]|nr:hypothetical protein [Nevskiaceae bacterium]
MKDRLVKYQLLLERSVSSEQEAPLPAFIFALGYFNAMNCGLIPPLAVLNSFLKSGRSTEAAWVPFELDAAEYAALEAQLLKPDIAALSNYTPHTWQTFERDASIDQYTDPAQWQAKAREKHMAVFGQRMARLQHEMVMAKHRA